MGEATSIQYCAPHYDELIQALIDRQLQNHLSMDSEDLANRLERGETDAGLEASVAITGSALSLFGPDSIMEHGGCPVCAFQNVINHVADHMAFTYLKVN